MKGTRAESSNWIHFGSGDAHVTQVLDSKRIVDGDTYIEGHGVVEEVTDHSIKDLRNDDFEAILGVGPCEGFFKFNPHESKCGTLQMDFGVQRFSFCFNEDMTKSGYLIWNDK